MGGHWSAIRFFEGLIDRHFPQRDFWPGAVFECPATQDEAAIAIAISPHRETLADFSILIRMSGSGLLPVCRLATRKGGVLLHFNHIATVSTRWRGQNLFESLALARYLYRLPTEIHRIRRLGTALGEPSVISTTRPHAKQ
jgi:hypothetical protein